MNTLVDQINAFKVKPENLNIPLIDFREKLMSIGVSRVVMPNTSDQSKLDLFVRVGTQSSLIQIHKTDNYKELLSQLIKKHVVSFCQVWWK